MNLNPTDPLPQCVLLDIEGTTTPIDFVYRTLFPFARAHVKDYLLRHWHSTETQADVAQLRAERANDIAEGLHPPAIAVLDDDPLEKRFESAVAFIHWLMDCDRKSTPLKSIQGRIWQEGYLAGELLSQVFDDVPPAFARWRRQDKRICIYSSGSVLAQKLLFAHTTFGDLTTYISHYFDTAIGAKVDPNSYRRIADTLSLAPSEILFASDVIAELDAAGEVGLKTVLTIRPGNRLVDSAAPHATVGSFSSL